MLIDKREVWGGEEMVNEWGSIGTQHGRYYLPPQFSFIGKRDHT